MITLQNHVPILIFFWEIKAIVDDFSAGIYCKSDYSIQIQKTIHSMLQKNITKWIYDVVVVIKIKLMI